MTKQDLIEELKKCRLKECKETPKHIEALEVIIEALEKTSDESCSMCAEQRDCPIYDDFNVDYCSNWRVKYPERLALTNTHG